MNSVPISFACPLCKIDVKVEIDSEKVLNSERNPVPIVVPHGTPEHAVTIFVDREYRVRAISTSDIVQRIADAEEKRTPFTRQFVPFPLSEKVTLTGLDNAQITIIALADGKRSGEEMAKILDIPEMRVKILCEQLVRMGKLESVRVVISEE